ncbi:gpW family head-tail joining protein [Vreelandella lionensis]|jgi:hypothetical protein|uniref:GpW family head-tail joining protein n=1 Tax=Vreelandella lionensis TaxID=1144478 RepID=A0ABW8BRI4_9GAMM
MAYTADNLAQVRQAILDLASGQRVTRITHNGRTVDYGQADIDKLRSLERHIAADVSAQNRQRRSRTRQVITSKGL